MIKSNFEELWKRIQETLIYKLKEFTNREWLIVPQNILIKKKCSKYI